MIDRGMSLINDTLHIHIPDAPEVNKVIYNGVEFVSGAQWIPCTPETMPEEAGAYLCTCKDAERLMITLIKWQPRMKSWNLTGARTYWKVIAWLPLPEPYKEEEDGCVHQ